MSAATQALLVIAYLLILVTAGESSPSRTPTATPPVWVVSLSRRPERVSSFMATGDIAQQWPQLRVFEATDGRAVDLRTDMRVGLRTRVDMLKGRIRRNHQDISSYGAIGQYLTQYKMYETFLANSTAPYAILFEDDAVPPRALRRKVKSLLAEELPPPEHFDFWLFGVLAIWSSVPVNASDGLRGTDASLARWRKVGSFIGIQAYLVTRRGAARAQEGAWPISQLSDAHLGSLAELGRLTILYRGSDDPELNVPQRSGLDSSIKHTNCPLCELPADFSVTAHARWHLLYGATLAAAAWAALYRSASARDWLIAYLIRRYGVVNE